MSSSVDLVPESYVDEYDDVLAAAAQDSRERFLKQLGPIRQYLERDDVYNVNVNEGDEGLIFVEAASGKFEAPETMSRAQRESLIGRIATESRTVINELRASLAADMPYGFNVRVQAFCPPISDWPIMLRKHAVRRFTFDDYSIRPTEAYVSEKPACSARGIDAIRAAILRGDNTIISGRPNGGKSTLLGAYMDAAAATRPHARLVSIQDRKELKKSHRDSINLLALVEQARFESAGHLDRYEYSFNNALRDALRTGFDMLVWGELRDGDSARSLLAALNTGARGLATTLHADSAVETLSRLEVLLEMSDHGLIRKRRMITRFVDLIIFMYMDEYGRRSIGDIQRVMGVDAEGEYVLESVI